MKYKILLGLFAIIIIVSGILTFVPIEKACKTPTNSCSIVQTSKYEKTLGINNSHLGLAGFMILFILTFAYLKKPTKKKKFLITLGTIGGAIFSIYFLCIQFFILHAACPYCLVADSSAILSFIVLIFIKNKPLKDKSQYETLGNTSLEIVK